MINFLLNLTDTQLLVASFLAMILMYLSIFLYTRSLLIALFTAEIIPIWNLTLYLTEWLGLGLKPIMSIWLCLSLILLPFITWTIYRLCFRQAGGQDG